MNMVNMELLVKAIRGSRITAKWLLVTAEGDRTRYRVLGELADLAMPKCVTYHSKSEIEICNDADGFHTIYVETIASDSDIRRISGMEYDAALFLDEDYDLELAFRVMERVRPKSIYPNGIFTAPSSR